MNTTDTTPTAPNATIITVLGDAEIHHPAERGTVRLSVGFEGATRAEILQSSTALHAEVVASVTALHNPENGPVTWWSNDQLRVWGQRPWNQQGKQLPVVYHSAASFTVKFSDFERLSNWLSDVSLRSGIKVDGITWDLTVATKKSLTKQVQRDAVTAAVTKAQIYAESLGLSQVTAIALSDPGLLTNSPAPQQGMMAMASARGFAGGDSGAGAQLKPEDITLNAAVHARFSAI